MMTVPRSVLRARRTLVLLTLSLLACPHGARAAGINLSWNDCGTSGASDKTFACTSNTGNAVAIGSFVAPSGINALLGVTATLDIWSSPDSVGTAIPDWWQLGPGGCRSGSLSASFDF